MKPLLSICEELLQLARHQQPDTAKHTRAAKRRKWGIVRLEKTLNAKQVAALKLILELHKMRGASLTRL